MEVEAPHDTAVAATAKDDLYLKCSKQRRQLEMLELQVRSRGGGQTAVEGARTERRPLTRRRPPPLHTPAARRRST